MKVTELLEDMRPLLLDLIQQRLGKLEPIKLDFVENYTRYQGYIEFMSGNTIHALHTLRNGDVVTDRYVLPLDADERFTLRKIEGVWHLQGI